MVGRSKYISFRGLKEKVWRRINSWKVNTLSSASKEILVKSVLQAIPAYTMSVFKLPGNLLNEMEAMFLLDCGGVIIEMRKVFIGRVGQAWEG